jgi:hypothetical protein
MYLIYMTLCIFSGIIVYFFIPETRMKPIEELGDLFGDEVVIHLTDNGLGIVEEDEMKLPPDLPQVTEVEDRSV